MPSRIAGVNPEEADDYARRVFEKQTQTWGAPLLNHLVYARCPAIFRAVRAIWTGLGSSGHIDEALQSLVNRRVAQWNKCDF